LGLTESTSVRLWAGYVEVVEKANDLQLLFNHPTLVEFYDGDAEVIMEDASAGATALPRIAPLEVGAGLVQRRPMPNPSIHLRPEEEVMNWFFCGISFVSAVARIDKKSK
jgi:hypothetical protein